MKRGRTSHNNVNNNDNDASEMSSEAYQHIVTMFSKIFSVPSPLVLCNISPLTTLTDVKERMTTLHIEEVSKLHCSRLYLGPDDRLWDMLVCPITASHAIQIVRQMNNQQFGSYHISVLPVPILVQYAYSRNVGIQSGIQSLPLKCIRNAMMRYLNETFPK